MIQMKWEIKFPHSEVIQHENRTVWLSAIGVPE